MRIRHLAVAASALLLSGCALFSSGERAPAPFQITLRAADRLNPDEQGRSLPTAVRVYQLKGPGRLEAADYDDLYRRDKAVLGEELVQVDEMVLAPGQAQTRSFVRDRAARFLAVVAVVRRPAGSSWRSLVELPAADDAAELEFRIVDYRIERK